MRTLFHRHQWRETPPKELIEEKKVSQWIRERGSDFHPAFTVSSQYDSTRKRYIPSEKAAIEYLTELVETHDAGCAADEQRFSDCSWETVLKKLDDAKDEYSSRQQHGASTMMGLDLAFKMTDVIPEEYGLGVIKGVLGIMFERIENRAKILEAFESIPETILTINFSCSLLNPTAEDEKLRQEFHSTLVKRMPELIDILLGKPAWYQRLKGYMTFKIRETLTVDEILAEWKQYISTLNERVMRMRDRLRREIAYHSAEAHQLGVQANNKLDVFGNRFDEIQSTVIALGPAIMAAMQRDLGGRLNKLERALEARDTGAEAQTILFHEFQELEAKNRLCDIRIHNMQEEIDSLSHENQALRLSTSQLYVEPPCAEPQAIVTPLELLGLIGVSPQAALEDLEFVLLQSERHTERSLGQVRWLTRMDEFVQWYHESRSCILLVDGYVERQRTDSIAPTSVFDANLVLSLVRNASRIVLYFFAGRYSDDLESPLSGPSGLVRSLITQLLSHEKFRQPDLSFLTEEWLEGCRTGDIRALCELLKQLFLQVPADMQVYCVLDGLVVYEYVPRWEDEIDYVAALFQHLVQETRIAETPVVKTLMTFAYKSLQISDRVERFPRIWTHAALAAGYVDSMPMMM
ncbi:hypothetical protein BDV25DRAFT_103683 [Aspergillus avenaceus]|uniref:Nephrocystin 3-like N-terminal domain-containing protein n=1 Tax=Aspergillus avenaceus TaxID=36643 RepID=A0A5N6TX97_ASPAV|nr:hypothetical protein BDV25DRAFT_103683 [Aspergillus avenaceus]